MGGPDLNVPRAQHVVPRVLRRSLTVFAAALLALLALPSGALGFGPLSSFGSHGEAAGQFSQASGLAIGPDGAVYVSEFEPARIDAFDAGGNFLFAFGKGVNPNGGNTCSAATGCQSGSEGSGAGAMHDPAGIEFGPDGNLYVADDGNNRIDVFSPRGEFLRALGRAVNADQGSATPDVCTAGSGCRIGEESGAAGGMSRPEGLGLDSSGNLYVADSENNRIDLFAPDGEFIRAYGLEVNAEPMAANRDVCTPAGGCRAGRGLGDSGALSGPNDVQVAPDGKLLVSDVGNHRLDVFAADGEFIRAFGKNVNFDLTAPNRDVCTIASPCQNGSDSSAAGGFGIPGAIGIDRAGQVLIADPEANRVDLLNIDTGFVEAFGAGVADGGGAFQVCALLCQKGSATEAPGALPRAVGVAVDCRGAIYVESEGAVSETQTFARVQRFGEPGTPVCGRADAPGPRPMSSGGLKLVRLILNRKRGTATLVVQVSGPGGLRLTGRGLRTARATAKAAGRIRLAVMPTARLKRALARIGSAKARVRVTFDPDGGTAVTKTRLLRLKKKLVRRRGR